VQKGDLAGVTRALARDPGLVNRTGKHPVWGGRPQALHLAIVRGNQAMFDLLLERGASAEGDNTLYDHWSPLLLSVHRERRELTHELARRVGHISLIDALFMGDDATALLILQVGEIMLQRTMPNDATLLHFTVTPDPADRLIELGVPLSTKDKSVRTALDQPAAMGARDVVDVLVDHGAEASPATRATLGDIEALGATLAGATPDDDLLIAAVIARQVPAGCSTTEPPPAPARRAGRGAPRCTRLRGMGTWRGSSCFRRAGRTRQRWTASTRPRPSSGRRRRCR